MGLPALVRAAEHGADIVVERRHEPVAALIGIDRLEQLRPSERDLQDISLVRTRVATDSGRRTELDQAIEAFDFDRTALEAALAEDLADVLSRLGRPAPGVKATPEADAAEPLPEWLVHDQVTVANVPAAEVAIMSLAEALDAWGEWRATPG